MRMKPLKKPDGYFITAKVDVPLKYRPVVGKKQLRKSGIVDCANLQDAKLIQAKWTAELKKRASGCELTYAFYGKLYQDQAGNHARSSIVNRLIADLGKREVDHNLETHFEDFIALVSREKVKRWKKLNGALTLDETEKPVSSSTVQAYKRYHKAIINFAKGPDCPPEYRIKPDAVNTRLIRIGRTKPRMRPIEESERNKYLSEALKYGEWFYNLVQFARSMPIRPEDQINLLTSEIQANWHIPYLPGKTKRTGKIARPRILNHMRDFAQSRRIDSDCPYLFYRPGFERNGEDTGTHYKISYHTLNSVHNTVCRRAEIKNLQLYDWRHDAVNYLLSLGFSKTQIMEFAGWSSPTMVEHYNAGDPERLAEICDIIEREAERKLKGVVIQHRRRA